MGIVEQLRVITSNVQQGAKTASISLSQRLLRLVTGFFVGIVLALIIQEFMQSGTLMLVFFTILFMMIVYRLLRALSLLQILIFDVICVLIAVSLRMYIMIAP